MEAIATEFEPVAIHNNKAGADREVLERYGEPAWNNPVTRFLDAAGKDLIPRAEGVWTTTALAARMARALAAAKRPVPEYLRLCALPEDGAGLPRLTFAMACFWEGEARLGALDGVAATRAGFLDGREVVEVTFDPELVSPATLVQSARQLDCARAVFVHDRKLLAAVPGAELRPQRASDAPPADQKHGLRRSPLRWLPLLPAQEARIHAALAAGTDAERFLSPGQRALLRRIEAALAKVPDCCDALRPAREVAAWDGYLRALVAVVK